MQSQKLWPTLLNLAAVEVSEIEVVSAIGACVLQITKMES